ncbi:MAG TPA: transcription termination/antitermination NusG family protein [Thermoanaerobaculia bacterium]|nr:transcription termination/antitermination NusG family protein [Thermoanaerobaculia bacterium]
MPILKRESDIFPETLFELDDADRLWRVAHVKSRQEKVLARYLLERNIPFYLPQTEQTTKRSGRTFKSYTPLFGGYVFVRTIKEDTLTIRRSEVIANLIDVHDQHQLQEELHQLHRLQQSGALLVPYPELTVGDKVRVTEGVFKGYEGLIVREKGDTRLVVSISMLRQSVAAEFGRESIAPARKVA